MGFNKRYFSEKSIISFAKTSEYLSFERWMLNPDACIFSDDASSKLWNSFLNSDEKQRQKIFNKLRK